MWFPLLPDAHVRLALAPDARLVRASDCTSGWRVLYPLPADETETSIEPPSFEFLSVLLSAERDMLPHLLDGDCGMCETSTSQGSGWPKIKPRHLFLNSI
jgi:hypothetical protein